MNKIKELNITSISNVPTKVYEKLKAMYKLGKLRNKSTRSKKK